MHSFADIPQTSSSSGSCQNESDLLLAIATLVVEGRIPGPSGDSNAKTKDFHEGPHCNQIIGTNRKHKCDNNSNSGSSLCKRFDRIREVVLTLYKKRIPLCIEVYFTCACRETEDVEVDDLESAILLEQWYFSIGCEREKNGSTAPLFHATQLISAIRSQLYFSQITAWLVTQDKELPITAANLRYRLSSPDEISASLTFSLTSSKHDFPTADLGNGNSLTVSFLSAPRLTDRPISHCHVCSMNSLKLDSNTDCNITKTTMNLVDDRMHTNCTLKGKHCCYDMEDCRDGGSGKREACAPGDCAIGAKILRYSKKTKPKVNVHHQYNSHDIASHDTTDTSRHNNNNIDLNKPVQDKGQLLLDAIERSGRSECDKFNCDTSERDTLFSISKEKRNFNNYVGNNHCDSHILIRNVSSNKNNSTSSSGKKSTGATRKITFDNVDEDAANHSTNSCNIPLLPEQTKVKRNLGSTVFDARTGLPLSSSPAPIRKGKTKFDFDSSLTSVSAIKSALFSNSFSTDEESESDGSIVSPCSPEVFVLPNREVCPLSYSRRRKTSNLLGSFEESMLCGRFEPVSRVYGFTAELGASGSFVPKHKIVPVMALFFSFSDHDSVSAPYLGHISLGKKGYNVPKTGTVQVTLSNPQGTVVKMFVLPYDLSEMPPNSQTFIRQRTFYMPANYGKENAYYVAKWLRFVIHVRFMSSKSGKIYLHKDIRMIIMRKSDMDTATAHDMDTNYELRSFAYSPTNPQFYPRK